MKLMKPITLVFRVAAIGFLLVGVVNVYYLYFPSPKFLIRETPSDLKPDPSKGLVDAKRFESWVPKGKWYDTGQWARPNQVVTALTGDCDTCPAQPFTLRVGETETHSVLLPHPRAKKKELFQAALGITNEEGVTTPDTVFVKDQDKIFLRVDDEVDEKTLGADKQLGVVLGVLTFTPAAMKKHLTTTPTGSQTNWLIVVGTLAAFVLTWMYSNKQGRKIQVQGTWSDWSIRDRIMFVSMIVIMLSITFVMMYLNSRGYLWK